jgi:hypothetical protein
MSQPTPDPEPLDPAQIRAAILAGQCPWCNRTGLTVPAMHTAKVHGIDKRRLRELADLPWSAPIADPDYTADRVQRGRSNQSAITALRRQRPRDTRSVSKAGRRGRGTTAALTAETRRKIPLAAMPDLFARRAAGDTLDELAAEYGVTKSAMSMFLTRHEDSVAAMWPRWVNTEHPNMQRASAQLFSRIWRRYVAPRWAATPAAQVQLVEAMAWVQQIADTVGEPTAAHCRWVLGALLQEAVTAGVIEANPLRSDVKQRRETVQRLSAEGLPAREIAGRLGLSVAIVTADRAASGIQRDRKHSPDHGILDPQGRCICDRCRSARNRSRKKNHGSATSREVRFEDSMWQAIRAQAGRQGITGAEFIRAAVSAHISSGQPEPGEPEPDQEAQTSPSRPPPIK